MRRTNRAPDRSHNCTQLLRIDRSCSNTVDQRHALPELAQHGRATGRVQRRGKRYGNRLSAAWVEPNPQFAEPFEEAVRGWHMPDFQPQQAPGGLFADQIYRCTRARPEWHADRQCSRRCRRTVVGFTRAVAGLGGSGRQRRLYQTRRAVSAMRRRSGMFEARRGSHPRRPRRESVRASHRPLLQVTARYLRSAGEEWRQTAGAGDARRL